VSLPLSSPFVACDWEQIEETRHQGERGIAYWRTQHYGDVRVRQVRYTANYLADHWCERGHVLYVLEGSLTTELKDGREVALRAGMSYTVEDGAMAHRSKTGADGALLFIVD
jgi:mannose-6-phosphate isomerase-like protein (cupin superfamily)